MNKALLVTGGLSIGFFALGWIIYPYLIGFLLPHKEGVALIVTELNTAFIEDLKFAFAFALLSPAIILGWHFAKLTTVPHRLIFALCIIGFLVLALITRHMALQKAAEEQANMLAGTGIQGTIMYSSLMFGEFAAGGIVFGWIATFVTVLRFKGYKYGQKIR